MRNLTLCFAQANQMKGKQTPFDAYGQSPRWPTILQRVEAFKGPFMEEKLKRFQMSTKEAEAEYSDFTNRHLSDTSYAAKLAKEYLGLLYGGEVDASGTRRVSAIRGALTYQLRKLWGLGTLFGRAARDGSGRVDGREQEKKYRGDHRHHALDAIVVALTDDATIKAMSDAAARGLAEHGAAGYARLQWRWPTFRDDIREHLSELNVSHRMDNSFCSAAPHAETFYSPPVPADHERYPGCKTKTVVFLRKTLGKTGPTGLKKDDVSRIVNPVVRARVEDKLKALGNDDPAKAFKDPATHPLHPSGKPIHRVRVWEPDFTKTIGGGEHARRVLSGDNHCLAVLREQDGAWAGQIVTRLEALRWKQAAEEAKRRTVAPPPLLANESRPLEFMLFKNDTIELDDVGGRGLFVVRFISQEKDTLKAPKVEYTPVNEARDSGDIKDAQKATGRRGAKILKTTGPEGLQKLRCEKVHIDPLGNIIFREGDGKRVRVQP
jgi:CRISPR-associated endonuclease Csn1